MGVPHGSERPRRRGAGGDDRLALSEAERIRGDQTLSWEEVEPAFAGRAIGSRVVLDGAGFELGLPSIR